MHWTSKSLFTLLLLLLQLSVHPFVKAQTLHPSPETVYTFKLNQEIAPAAWRLVNNCFKEAEKTGASSIIIQLNTFGGELSNADLIRKRILDSNIPVYVLIDGNAASAGALISIACNKIYMKKGSTIGAASVVNEKGELLSDKYQSYMRGMMRATASQRNRDPKIAEGMVTPNNYLPEIADSGQVLTLTTNEAIKYNYCDGMADNIDSVCMLAGIKNYRITEHKESILDVVIGFLLNPIVNGILLMIIIAGIYFEFQHPGIGVPLFACIGAAILYFAPLYLDGLAANWEILIFVIGIILLAVEIFFIPGFGVSGALGLFLIIASLTLALVANNNFDFTITGFDGLMLALARIIAVMIIALILAVWFGRQLFRNRVAAKIVLTDTLTDAKGYLIPVSKLLELTGMVGYAKTDLRPSGSVEINGEWYDCISDGEFILKGSEVKVIEVRGNYPVVRQNA